MSYNITTIVATRTMSRHRHGHWSWCARSCSSPSPRGIDIGPDGRRTESETSKLVLLSRVDMTCTVPMHVNEIKL